MDRILHTVSGGGIMWFCPGCQCGHHVDKVRWHFNGNFEAPTLSPSVSIEAAPGVTKCHCFVVDGKIQFLADCEHSLKGQTVPMERF